MKLSLLTSWKSILRCKFITLLLDPCEHSCLLDLLQMKLIHCLVSADSKHLIYVDLHCALIKFVVKGIPKQNNQENQVKYKESVKLNKMSVWRNQNSLNCVETLTCNLSFTSLKYLHCTCHHLNRIDSHQAIYLCWLEPRSLLICPWSNEPFSQ